MAPLRITVVLFLTASVIAGLAVPGVTLASHTDTSDSDHPTAIDDGDVFAVSAGGQIHVWERAGYTLRTDDTEAATRITPPTIIGESVTNITPGNDFGDSQSLVRDFGDERNPIGVHDSGETVRLVFDANYATAGPYGGLNGQDNVQIVAARLDPEADRAFSSAGTFEFFSDITAANRNASFEVLTDDAAFNSTGQLTETARFESGRYIVFAAVHESGAGGIETGGAGGDPDNISVDGNVTIVGVDRLTVQEGQAAVTEPSSPTPGENLTFSVDTANTFGPDNGGSMTHAIALYDQSTFEDARFDVVVNRSALDGDASFEDVTQLERSINRTNGVVAVESGTTLGGTTLTDGEVQLPVGPESLIDFLADGGGVNDSSTHPITNGGASNTEYETLDASVTAVQDADRATTLSVGTYENFSTGEYRYVVVSSPADNASRFSTASGQVTLSADSGGGGSSSSTTDPITLTRTVSQNGSVSGTIDRVEADQRIIINIEQNGSEAGNGSSVWLDQLSLTSTGDARDVRITITLSDQPSPATPENNRNETNFIYVDVETQNLPNAENTPGTFTFRVPQQRLNESGIAPEEISMFRYHDTSWDAIDVTYRGDGRFEAGTPGFSWFAISGPAPSVSVTDTTLNTSTVSAGDSVELNVTVENTGTLAGTATLNVTGNSDPLDSRTVAVDANESATETFTLTLETPGSQEIAVNGESVGTVTVVSGSDADGTAPATESETTTGIGTTTESDPTPASGPPGDVETETPTVTSFLGGASSALFGIALIVLIIAVLGIVRYRRQE